MNQIIQQLTQSKQILLATHIHPDGDAVGSLLSLGLALEEIKKKVQLYNESVLPAVYNFLPSIHRIKNEAGDMQSYDTAIILDCSDLQRVGDAAESVSRIPTIINIDHHLTNSRFGNYQLIDPGASATTELVYRLISAMDIPITKAVAYAIYTGIMADTGSFRFSNTTQEAFKICHEMVCQGADPHKVAHHVYETISLRRVKLLNMLFDTIEVSENGRLSIMTLTQNMLHATGTSITDVSGLINYARRIENVKVAALLYERASGRRIRSKNGSAYHVSLRSDGSVDVANLAAVFGGGGHRSAAGFDIQSTLPELKHQLYSISDRL
ncbi:MAG: bifunctional oligoribonuclease/PAP phosphatase NrnA [Desulfobacterales bacterium]|nr:bifunctional oligoribonuclease/PAP phosphatase NrnA [Desulfobacterales bacterium]MBS3755349.1 bifunctional oligoribonuclease/PAP phosphatase NrnA [Desulfobacterales bacterium]